MSEVVAVRLPCCVAVLEGEVHVLPEFVDATGVSFGVAMSAGVDNAELCGDVESSLMSIGVDGSFVASLSG
jgi:hypothetical protein